METSIAALSKDAKDSTARHNEVLKALKELTFALSSQKVKKGWSLFR